MAWRIGGARRLAAALLAAAAGPAPARDGPPPPLRLLAEFATDPVWDDGRAEVSVYDAERVIYGVPRPHALTLVVVKEDLLADERVKAEEAGGGRRTVTVLKAHLTATVPTENYPYQLAASLFVDRLDPMKLLKASFVAHEWCGVTFQEAVTWEGPPRLHVHSYWEGEGDRDWPLPLAPGALLEEQLLVVARAADIEPGGSARLSVADPILSTRAREPVIRPATLTRAVEDEIVSTPSGPVTARRLDLAAGGGLRSTYWVEPGGARALVRMEASDGRKLLLRDRGRRAYWLR